MSSGETWLGRFNDYPLSWPATAGHPGDANTADHRNFLILKVLTFLAPFITWVTRIRG